MANEPVHGRNPVVVRFGGEHVNDGLHSRQAGAIFRRSKISSTLTPAVSMSWWTRTISVRQRWTTPCQGARTVGVTGDSVATMSSSVRATI